MVSTIYDDDIEFMMRIRYRYRVYYNDPAAGGLRYCVSVLRISSLFKKMSSNSDFSSWFESQKAQRRTDSTTTPVESSSSSSVRLSLSLSLSLSSSSRRSRVFVARRYRVGSPGVVILLILNLRMSLRVKVFFLRLIVLRELL